jgi:two-component system sensor histidine kinase KdpD
LLSAAENLTNVGLLYLLPVMLAATRYGLRTGIVTGLISSLAYNFFFIPPTHTFTIQDPQNIITVLVLLAVAAFISQLAARVREQALLAQRSAGQNSALAGFSRLLAGIGRREELGQVLCAEIARLFKVNTILLLPEGDDLVLRAAFPPEDDLGMLEDAAARWAFEHGRPAGRGSDTLTASEWLFRPVSADGKTLGVFGLANPDAQAPIRSDNLPLLLSLLDQAGLALERIVLGEDIASIAQLTERDRLRAAQLSSVSHDLRTPLTTFLGTLAQLRGARGEEEHIGAARIEAERLNRFVGNLLDMARIEAGALIQSTEPVDLADAVDTALGDLRRSLGAHDVQVDLPADLPLVQVDPQLFHHCLINLIDNATKHAFAGTTITLAARRDPAGLRLEILDQGPGIPPGEEKRIFETFTRIEGSDRKGGTGLGLAIVKGFAEAMGLSVSAGNRTGSAGACFALCFPASSLREVAQTE